MSGVGLQAATVAVLVASAGLAMAIAGTKKKLLRWRPAERRCPTCGRSNRYECPCRR